MRKFTTTRMLFASAFIAISLLAAATITYASVTSHIDKKDEIRENAIDTNTIQDFSTRADNIQVQVYGGSQGVLLNGRLYMWGVNHLGQLGLGHNNWVDKPTWVSSLGSNVKEFTMSFNYAGAIVDNRVCMWGTNNYGQLGLGDTSARSTPTMVSMLPYSSDTHSLSAGQQHAGVIVGSWYYTWGDGARYKLGHRKDQTNKYYPSRTEYISDYWYEEEDQNYRPLTMSLGDRASAGVVRMPNYFRTVSVWGDNDSFSNLGWSVSPDLSADFPMTWHDKEEDGRKFYGSNVQVSNGGNTMIALIDGIVWTWGENRSGQLGRGSTSDWEWAKPLSFFSGASYVYTNGVSSYAVSSGDLYSWGKYRTSTPRIFAYGNWTQVSTDSSRNSLGVNYGQVYQWSPDGSPSLLNISEYVTIDLNASNDPNGYRNDFVYNMDLDTPDKPDKKMRSLLNSSSSRISLPSSYNWYRTAWLGATPVGSNQVGQVSVTATPNQGYWFFTNYITIRGFKPVKDTSTVNTGNMVLNVKDKEPMFVNMGINQIVAEAKKNDESSLLAQWIYNKSGYSEIFNPNNFYTEYFPKNTKITGIDKFEYVANPTDPTKKDVRFKITVDRYYKFSGGNLIEWTTGPELPLNQYVTITNLPQVTYEEDIVDENKNLIILNTRINHNGKDISDADKFFTALTGNTAGGKVTDISLTALIRKYIDIRFIPDWYYDSDLKTKIPNNIFITRNYTDDVDTGTVKHIEFMIMADKYFTNYGELKSDYVNTAKFKIEQNTSDIQQIENTQELTKQYTTGDFIDLLAPNNETTGNTVPNNNINTKIAKDYLKFINFPGDTIYDLITTDEQNDNEQGKLTFKVSANQYYINSEFELQKESKTFDTFTLDGFKPAYDLTTYPVEMYHDKITQIQSSANFYDAIIDETSNDVDFKTMSQYINMLAIPNGANVSLIRLDNNNNSAIKFKIITDQYTDNGGRTINAMKEWEFEIKVASIDTTLIIILVTAGVFLVFLIWALIVTIKNKRSVEIQHGAEVI